MFVRPQSLRRSAVVLVALLSAGHAGAQLAAVSPFLPAQAAGGPAAPTAGAPLEFRGTMEDREGLLLRIVDPARKVGWWVRVNERNPEADFTVKQYDPERDLAVTEQQGRTFTLALREAKVVSSGSGAQMMAPPPTMPANVPPAVTNSVVVNPTPADEQRRLQAVADEVARRRQLREQASQQINQGAVVAPQVIQQQQEMMRQQNQQNLQQQQQGANQRGQGARGATIPGTARPRPQ